MALTNGLESLDPAIYLKPEFITQHLQKFYTKASRLMTGDNYNAFVRGSNFIGNPVDNTLYISIADKINDVLTQAAGRIGEIERQMSIPAGGWSGQNGIWRIDIMNPEVECGLRMPFGNEAGANFKWTPGGYTNDGVVEAVINRITKKLNGNLRVKETQVLK